MTFLKTSLIVIALAVLACLVVIAFRPDAPVVGSASHTPRGPSFQVKVVRPLSARPLFGILPTELEARLLGDGDLRFDSGSPGAKVGRVAHDRLELGADGWELVIEADGEGAIGPGTRLVFPVALAGEQRTLCCRPADRAAGYLRTAAGAGSNEVDGSFVVELATCENTETGKTIEWPPAPLSVRGSLAGVPRSGELAVLGTE